MEDVVTHEEDWKSCFAELGPGLVLFARQFVRSIADAEDIVQDAFVRFWRKQHSVNDKGLLYATVRSVALDLLRRDARRARREATASADMEQTTEPQFDFDDGSGQQQPKEDMKNKKGRAEITFNNYSINKGVADSIFQ